jgi:hypothetical protein
LQLIRGASEVVAGDPPAFAVGGNRAGGGQPGGFSRRAGGKSAELLSGPSWLLPADGLAEEPLPLAELGVELPVAIELGAVIA